MLHTRVLNDDPKWDQHLPLAELSYNNSYQESIKISPFEALYGRSCRTPRSWSKSDKRVIFGLDIVTEAEEKVKQIHTNILVAQSRQKSYTNKRQCALEFEVGDHIYLRVYLMKGVRRFGIKGKLAPRYIGPYPIIKKYGSLSYQLELPSKLSGVHNMFHISQLKRCLKPPTDMGIEDTIPLELDLTYKAYPIKILEQQDQTSQKKITRFYKVQWMTIQKMKPCETVKIFYDPIFRSFSHQGKFDPSPALFPYLNLGIGFLLRGGRGGCNTMCYGLNNYLH
jgi:hypothetical protein